MSFDRGMIQILNESSDAFQDLPDPLRDALKRYAASRSDEDLNEVILGVLGDLGADVSAITDDSNFIEDLGLDSLSITEFVFFFEDIFSLKISNEELGQIQTIGALKSYLKTRIG